MTTLGRGALSASSSAIDMNTKSACESEYIALSDHVTNAIFLRNFLVAQGYQMQPAKIMQDNQAAIRLAKNGFSSAARTRHINIRYFFVKNSDRRAIIQNTEQIYVIKIFSKRRKTE